VSSFFQPYHGENTLYFYVKVMVSALYYSNILSWNFLVEDHWTSPQLDMLLQSDILPWFRVNQFLLYQKDASWKLKVQTYNKYILAVLIIILIKTTVVIYPWALLTNSSISSFDLSPLNVCIFSPSTLKIWL
jgi:hypothetical protein